MYRLTLFMLAAVLAIALAVSEGQYYVPRAYYLIDAEGHASNPVPLRRLRRSFNPYPYASDANANSEAIATGGGTATANSRAISGRGDWGTPLNFYGASKPSIQSRHQSGYLEGRSVSASTSVGVDSSGLGYYDQKASVYN